MLRAPGQRPAYRTSLDAGYVLRWRRLHCQREDAEPLVDKVLERTESFVEEAKEKADPLVKKTEGSSGKDSMS